MRTPITSLARLARQALALSAPLLAAGALAAGCGTARVPAPGAAAGSPSLATVPPEAGPVPTVTGGPVAAGQPACAGWPADAPHARLPASFDPVTAERCVTGLKQVPGKGQWQAATLERATGSLGPLVRALQRPTERRAPGTVCPYLVMLPPQIAVTDSAGRALIPLLPLGGCGQVQPQVIAAIDALSWQPVSVRLIAPVRQPAGPGTVGPVSPKTIQTLPAAG